MWLLPHLSRVSAAAVHVYYRASRGGGEVPKTGPVLVVGNHPNSLLDPAFLAWAADRPVRFLAKAPLFSDRLVGWLVRGSGSIPVYRKQDDAAQMGKNEDTFRAVFDALAAGSAVALFPEGISHSQPGLAPLKTGAARIALGALPTVGKAFPIIPVGLVFRAKDRFRSEAHAVVGAPVAWDDLAKRSADDHDAVRELTARIDQAMRQVTVNLAKWEDELVVRTAEAVWVSTRQVDPAPAARVARLATAADVLAKLRASGDEKWDALARDVREHARVLRVLRLSPSDLTRDTTLGTAARWTVRRLSLVGALQAAFAAMTAVLFWIPYRLTGMIAAAMSRDKDTLSTYRVLGGAAVFIVWIALLAMAAGLVWGWRSGIAVGALLPIIAVLGLYSLEHWRLTLATARRWFVIRAGDARIVALRDRQRDLATRLDQALATHTPVT